MPGDTTPQSILQNKPAVPVIASTMPSEEVPETTALHQETQNLIQEQQPQLDISLINTDHMDTGEEANCSAIPSSPRIPLDLSGCGFTPVASLTPQTGGVLSGYQHPRQTEIEGFVKANWPGIEGHCLTTKIQQLLRCSNCPANIKPSELYKALEIVGIQDGDISKSTVRGVFRIYRATKIKPRLEVTTCVNKHWPGTKKKGRGLVNRILKLLQHFKCLGDSNSDELYKALINTGERVSSIQIVDKAFKQYRDTQVKSNESIEGLVQANWPRIKGENFDVKILELLQCSKYLSDITSYEELYKALKKTGERVSRKTVQSAHKLYNTKVRPEVTKLVNDNKDWLILKDHLLQVRIRCLLKKIEGQEEEAPPPRAY